MIPLSFLLISFFLIFTTLRAGDSFNFSHDPYTFTGGSEHSYGSEVGYRGFVEESPDGTMTRSVSSSEWTIPLISETESDIVPSVSSDTNIELSSRFLQESARIFNLFLGSPIPKVIIVAFFVVIPIYIIIMLGS